MMILDENKVYIPFVTNLEIGMSSFLNSVEAEIPKFAMLISMFSNADASSTTSFFDVFIPILTIVESLVRLTFRHQGELPNESYLTKFCEALEACFKVMGKSALVYSISMRIDGFAKGVCRLIHIADESVTSRFTIGKKSIAFGITVEYIHDR
jgi:hypothetical protein